MLNLSRTTLLALSAGLLLGCSNSSSTEPPPPSVELLAFKAVQADTMGTAVAEKQQLFVKVDMSLLNRMAVALPLKAENFSVLGADETSYPGDKATLALAEGCKDNAEVATGATERCWIVFSTPSNVLPTTIVYTAPDNVKYTAPLEVTPCQACGDRCPDFTVDPKHCGGCDKPVGLGTCAEGYPACQAGAFACNGVCVDLLKDPKNCGSCGKDVGKFTLCVDGKPQPCMSPTTMACDGTCIDPMYDSKNCGSCGHACTQGACSKGLCCENKESTDRVDCATVCGDMKCEAIGGTYESTNCTPSKIVLLGLGTCNDVPLEKDVSDGCEVVFKHIDCSCCQ
ncbi:MAG: hypothetical protein HY898_15720 [Deltaproteobacteria bacterium]|nr:hypothetical protein [Deltaproteobacteria bacterium]